MNTDKVTTGLGILLGILHQVGLVGVVPTTKQEWAHTGASVVVALLGYYTNKL